MQLRTRLFASFGVLLTLTASACGIALLVGQRVGRNVETMIDVGAAAETGAGRARAGVARAELGVARFLAKPAAEISDAVNTEMGAINDLLGELSGIGLNEEASRHIAEAIAACGDASVRFKTLHDLFVSRGFSEKEGSQGELRAAAHEIEKAVADQGLAELTVLLLQCRRHEKDYLLRGDTKYVGMIGERVKEFQTQMGQFGLPADTQKATMALWEKYQAGIGKVASMDATILAERSAFDAAIVSLRESTEAITKIAQTEIASQRAGVVGALGSQRSVLIMVCAAGVLIGVTISLVTTRAITRPVIVLRDAMGRASGGDLTVNVDGSRADELGALAREFNHLVERTSGMIAEVADASQRVRSGALEIAQESRDAVATMGHQSSRLTGISAAMEEMSASVAEVAQKTGSASSSAAEAGGLAESGGDLVVQTISDMGEIERSVTQGSDLVSDLGRRSEQIGKIVSTINDIAEQTNLLALNAAIEAARAGEHGRGFAVVADEVRKLADRTTVATAEVARSITSVREQTSKTIEQMSTGATSVRQGVERANAAGSSIEKIIGSAAQVADMVRSIAAATTQQRTAAEDISTNLMKTGELAKETETKLSAASHAAENLSTLSDQLTHLVGRFTIAKSGRAVSSTPGR
jgi:methyl-accepting chemotaxis protein